jgi:hypothetical protein
VVCGGFRSSTSASGLMPGEASPVSPNGRSPTGRPALHVDEDDRQALRHGTDGRLARGNSRQQKGSDPTESGDPRSCTHTAFTLTFNGLIPRYLGDSPLDSAPRSLAPAAGIRRNKASSPCAAVAPSVADSSSSPRYTIPMSTTVSRSHARVIDLRHPRLLPAFRPRADLDGAAVVARRTDP